MNKIERDDDSKNSHPALSGLQAATETPADSAGVFVIAREGGASSKRNVASHWPK
jgi:hypothetical protein